MSSAGNSSAIASGAVATSAASTVGDNGVSHGFNQLALSTDPSSSKGSAANASGFAFTASTNGDQGLSHDNDQNGLLTKTSALGNDHTIDLSGTGGVPANVSVADTATLGGDHAFVPLAANAAAGTSIDAGAGSANVENKSNGGFTHTALSSLLNVLTGDQTTEPSATDAFMLSGADHSSTATSGSPALGGDHVTLPTVETALGGDHANVPALGASSPFTSVVGADNFVFHPNLGHDNVRNSESHAAVFESSNVQNSVQLSTFAPEHLVPEIMFDPTHHDATDISATVSQFHQMASSGTLLH